MRYLDNTKILCLEAHEFVPDIMTEDNLRQNKSRGKVIVHGVGGNGRERLIEIETLPKKYKQMVWDKYGDPYEYFATQPLLAMLQQDMEARAFYEGYILPDGRHLPQKYQIKYSRQCDWFNMVNVVLADTHTLKEELNISVTQFWDKVIALTKADKIDNGLPKSYRRFSEKLRVYNDDGYEALISNNFCNQKTRKVTDRIEQLLINLYLMPERPYYKNVVELYDQFIKGDILVFDVGGQTGELFEPQDFYVDGKPYVVSDATVRYYINKPSNRAVVDKQRMSNLQYVTKHRPHNIRKAPAYALSKITMDDITIPFKMPNGNRVWCYEIFDVASQAVIGVSFSKDKSQDLIRNSLRDMLRRIARNGWGMPLEVEIEQHLNSGMKGKKNDDGVLEADVFTEGAVFPFVTFCAAKNPQQKRAEGFIRLKKYGFQKKRAGFQYRPFAKSDANRKNEDVADKTFGYDDIVGFELQDIAAYNNALHSDQERYPNMTRWEVLEQNMNPELTAANKAAILPYIGHKAGASNRNGYVDIDRGFLTIRGCKYKLPNISMLDRFVGGKAIAYYLDDEYGDVSYVHLYDRNEQPVCEAVEVTAYQEAKAERTDDDKRIREDQAKYISSFDKMVADKTAKVTQVGVVSKERAAELDNEPEQQPQPEQEVPDADSKQGGYAPKEEADKPWWMDEEQVAARARRGI